MKLLRFIVLLYCLSILSFSVSAQDVLAVNINTADAVTLSERLTGVGLKKAEAIVEYRKQHGEFKSVEQIAEVKGIGESTIEKNRAMILLQ
jgi:competence protein ComEA